MSEITELRRAVEVAEITDDLCVTVGATEKAQKKVDELTKSDLEGKTFKATLNRVRVRMVKQDNVTKGGILLTDTTANREKMACDAGVVMDMGADAYADYADNRIKVGSVVLFAKYAGAIVPGTEDRERIINDTDVYGLADEVTNG